MGIAPGNLPACFAQVFPEIVRTGEGAEFVGGAFNLGTSVHTENPVHLGIGSHFGGIEVEGVAAAHRPGDAVIGDLEPGGFGIYLGKVDGMAGLGGRHLHVYGVFVKAEGVAASSVVCSHVIVLPGRVLQEAFHRGAVADNATVDALDALFPQQGFPFPEEGIGLEGDGGILRADGGVSPAYDVHVPVQGAVGLEDAGIAQGGAEAEVRPQGMEGYAGGDEFAVGSGHQADACIIAGQHLAGGIFGIDAPGGTLEGLPGSLAVDVLLGRCLGRQGQGGENQAQKYTRETFHINKSNAFSA